MPLQSVSQIEERRKASIWTRIHPFFAIGQLGVFFVSVTLLGFYFAGRVPFHVVHISVLIKVGLMVGAVITGALWERDVYGMWWFAKEFFVEDIITVVVFALHVVYLACVYTWPANLHFNLALLGVAYIAYITNAGQYIWRHRKNQRNAQRRADQEERAA